MGSGSSPGATARTTTANPAVARCTSGSSPSAGLPAGYAADDGAALVFRDGDLHAVMASRPEARAYRVEPAADGTAVETELETRYLGA